MRKESIMVNAALFPTVRGRSPVLANEADARVPAFGWKRHTVRTAATGGTSTQAARRAGILNAGGFSGMAFTRLDGFAKSVPQPQRRAEEIDRILFGFQ